MLKHATPRSSPSLNSTSPSPQNLKSCTPSPSSFSTPKDDGKPMKCTQPNIFPVNSDQSQSNSVLSNNVSTYNERGVDCDGINTVYSPPAKKGTHSSGLSFGSFLGDKILSLGSLSTSGTGIGPVITHGKAIVRRGLSFNSKKDSDSVSIRSVKSEGQGFQVNEIKRTNLPQKANSVMALQASVNKLQENGVQNEHLMEKCDEENFQKDPQESTTVPPSIVNSKPAKQSAFRSSSRKIFGLSKHDHPSLKSLLRLPGVYGHIPVPESAPCGTPHILSPDSLSLNSSDSFVSSNSGRTSSRSWSSNTSSNSNNTSDSSNSNCSSTSEPTSTTLKIFAKCLRSDIEYKTVNIGSRVTCRQLINLLLSKARMRHRDPNLFYLTMEVTVRRWSGVPVRALLVLEEAARPAQLALCRPLGDLKFVLQMRRGGVVKIHDTVLMPGSQYKSLLVSYKTTTEESVQLLLNCYGRRESKHYYALHEVCQSPEYSDRRLGQTEKPLEVKAEWPRDRRAEFVFVLRRNMTQALSLRKLSMRTSEEKDTKEQQNGRVPPVGLNPNRHSESKCKNIPIDLSKPDSVDEMLIDCTSTTPVIRTLKPDDKMVATQREENLNKTWIMARREENMKSILNALDVTHPLTSHRRNDLKEWDKNSEVQDDSPIRCDNADSKPDFHSLPKQYNKSLTANMHKSTSKLSQNEGGSFSNKVHDNSPIRCQNQDPSDLHFKPNQHNKSPPESEHTSMPRLPQTEDKSYNVEPDNTLIKCQNANTKSNCHSLPKVGNKNVSTIHPNSTSQQHNLEKSYTIQPDNAPIKCQNANTKSSCHSLPKVGNKNVPNDRHNSTLQQNIEGSPDILSDYNRLSMMSKYNPRYYMPNNRKSTTQLQVSKRKEAWPLVYRENVVLTSKIVSTSAVQTELTCIPVKGLKNKHKWNSVETLLETYPIKSKNSETQTPNSQPKIVKDLMIPKSDKNELESKEKPNKNTNNGHKPGKHCNCKECFYI